MDWLQTFYDSWALLRPALGAVLCLAGGGIAVVGAIGVVRFPDFYTRLHAASVTDTGAALLLLFGMVMLSPNMLTVIKLVAIGFFLFLTSPTASHAIANAAHTAKLEPLIGRIRSRRETEEEI